MEGWDWESQCLEKVRERTENWRIQPSLSIIRLSQFRPWSNPPTVKAKLTDYYLMNHSSPEGGHLLTSAASFLLENCSEFVFQLLQCSLIASHDQTPHFQLETRTKKGYFSQSKEFCLSCVRTLCLEFASTLYIRHHNLCNGFCYFLFQPSTAHNTCYCSISHIWCMHSCDLCRLHPVLDYKSAGIIATSIVHLKLPDCKATDTRQGATLQTS